MRPADFILRKALVAADVPSSQWSKIQADLRNRAFFMSRVTNERLLSDARRGVRERLESGKSASEIRRDLRKVITEEDRPKDPKDRDTIKDVWTKRRLDTMIEQNVRQAKGYAEHIRATTQGALLAFPAYELVRERRSKEPRNWDARWRKAAEAVGWRGVNRKTDEKIALKTSDVWKRLSAFGNPFPPFDWGSGMGIADVPREKAEELGLVGDGIEEQTPPKVDLNGHLVVSEDMDGEAWKNLKKTFKDQIHVDQKTGTATWRDEDFWNALENGGNFAFKLGKPQPSLVERVERLFPGGCDFNGWKNGSMTATETWLNNKREDGTDHRSHFQGYGDDRAPLERGDIALLPALWKNPDRVELGKDGKNGVPRLKLKLDALDGGTYCAVVDIGTDQPFLKTFYKISPEEAHSVPRYSGRKTGPAAIGQSEHSRGYEHDSKKGAEKST